MTKAAKAGGGSTKPSNLITICPNFSHFQTLRGLKKFSRFMDITRALKIFQILAYQTLSVKQCYNNLMGRNYFSKHGGPYFINDGYSRHSHDHPNQNELDKGLAVFIAVGLLSLLAVISTMLIVL